MDAVLTFDELVRWRRDVRRFREGPVDPVLLNEILQLADLSPSVGNSQPWRIVEVCDPARRALVRASFERENERACELYCDGKADLYRSLKLAGFDRAPVHLAIFCDPATEQGFGLGRQTMPEMLRYSCVTFITTLWFAARAKGLGLGWVSILDPKRVSGVLSVPDEWLLIGYLLLGWPEEDQDVPELERAGWQARTFVSQRRLVR